MCKMTRTVQDINQGKICCSGLETEIFLTVIKVNFLYLAVYYNIMWSYKHYFESKGI